MLTRNRTTPDHVDTLVVTKQPDGWQVEETHDRTVVRTKQYQDWHRVERAVQVFDLQTAGYSTNR